MSNKPDFIIYNVTKQKDKPDYWNKLGGGFEFFTEDGRMGINFPNMKLVIIQPKPEEAVSED